MEGHTATAAAPASKAAADNVAPPSNETVPDTTPTATSPKDEGPSLAKVCTLLRTKNDTSRFAGLAVLRAFLDNSAELRNDQATLVEVWECVPVVFIDRLVRTGTGAIAVKRDGENIAGGGGGDMRDQQQRRETKKEQAKDMLDLAVSVLHTFALLLPDETRQKSRCIDRIPRLVDALLNSSQETTKLILQILASLVSLPAGADALVQLDDTSALVEIAPQHPEALDVLFFAWLGATPSEGKDGLASRIDYGMLGLALAFKGTDAVTLLAFVGRFFRDVDVHILPPSPRWLRHLIAFIHDLVAKRPSAEARHAYMTAVAALLLAYPSIAAPQLFSPKTTSDKPASYLLLNLVLVDIRTTIPTLLPSLNDPNYAATSFRIACGFDMISSFVGFLVRCLDDEEDVPLPMPPDLILKLRKNVGETMSLTIEYLRDRWDAAHAGAMGLHPDARPGPAHASSSTSRLPLAWDSAKGDTVENDGLVLAAIRALSLWLREDENDMLRSETTGLTDMVLDLYESSCRCNGAKESRTLDFRPPVLAALEAMSATEDGIGIILQHNAWAILSKDLTTILSLTSEVNDVAEALRGTEIVRVLLPIVEVSGSSAEEWMGLVTVVAGWDCPVLDSGNTESVTEFHVAVLQLVCALVVGARSGMRRRYVHSVAAIRGITEAVAARITSNSPLREGVQDVMDTLGRVQQ